MEEKEAKDPKVQNLEAISGPKKLNVAWMGSMQGKMEILGDILEPVMEDSDWEALR